MGSVDDVGRDTLELLVAQQENFLDRRHVAGHSEHRRGSERASTWKTSVAPRKRSTRS